MDVSVTVLYTATPKISTKWTTVYIFTSWHIKEIWISGKQSYVTAAWITEVSLFRSNVKSNTYIVNSKK